MMIWGQLAIKALVSGYSSPLPLKSLGAAPTGAR